MLRAPEPRSRARRPAGTRLQRDRASPASLPRATPPRARSAGKGARERLDGRRAGHPSTASRSYAHTRHGRSARASEAPTQKPASVRENRSSRWHSRGARISSNAGARGPRRRRPHPRRSRRSGGWHSDAPPPEHSFACMRASVKSPADDPYGRPARARAAGAYTPASTRGKRAAARPRRCSRRSSVPSVWQRSTETPATARRGEKAQRVAVLVIDILPKRARGTTSARSRLGKRLRVARSASRLRPCLHNPPPRPQLAEYQFGSACPASPACAWRQSAPRALRR